MKSPRIILLALAILALGAVVFMASPARGATSQSPSQQTAVLQNPGFEGGSYMYNNDGDQKYVPQGWTPWWNATATFNCKGNPPADFQKPHYELEQHSTHVHGGIQSARWWTGYTVHQGGLYQTVAAQAGTTYQFSAWAFGWSSKDGVVDGVSAGPVDLKVGIDPTGGTNANASSVVWGATLSVTDKFVQVSAQATASAPNITVFLYDRPYWCFQRNDSFWDDTALAVTATGPTPLPGGGVQQPTQKPSSGVPAGSIVPATPQPDGSIVHTVHSGESCIGIAVTYGVTVDDILRLNNLSSCKIIIPGQKLIVKGPSGPTPTPTLDPAEATNAAATLAAQPTATPQQVAETKPAIVCVMIYDDKNGNNLPDPTEPKVPGLTITVSNGTSTVDTYTTDGTNEPHCFNNLAAGNYSVSWSGDGYTPIGDQTWQVSVGAGQTAPHYFPVTAGSGGSISGPTASDSGGGLPLWATALIAAIGVILFLGGLGVAAYFLVLRRSRI